jgi:peptidyl-prolyl cis-trans isomerase C
MNAVFKKMSRRAVWPLLLAGGLAAGCGRPAPEASVNAPLARVGNVDITETDYAFEVQRRRESGRPLGEPQAILEDLVQRQVLLQEAARSEILQDPAIRRELENRQLGQWLDRSLQIERDSVRVTDEELRSYYETQRDAFTRPEMSRLAILYRRTSPRDSEETLAALREDLLQGRAAYLADPAAANPNGTLSGFGTLAIRYSEDAATRYRGGDLGWQADDGVAQRLPAAVIEAGLALEINAVSEVIAAVDGLYVVLKSDGRPAQATSYEEVAPTLRRRLIRLKQEEVERTFVSRLMTAARIEINSDRAAALQLPPGMDPAPPLMSSVKEFAPNRE